MSCIVNFIVIHKICFFIIHSLYSHSNMWVGEIFLYLAGNYPVATSNMFASKAVQVGIPKIYGKEFEFPDYFLRMCIDQCLVVQSLFQRCQLL